MYLIQSVLDAHGVWKPIQKDRYSMTVAKLCNRLCSRAGIRSEYTSALKKHGTVIIPRHGQIVKMEIKLEESDDKHQFTGSEKDFTDGQRTSGKGSEVHAGRGDAGANEQPGSVSPDPEVANAP